MKVFLSLFVFTVSVLSASLTVANPNLRPPSFTVTGLTEKVAFADFKKANYHITYDLAAKTAKAQSTIEFEVLEEGYLVFDLVPSVSQVTIDNKTVEVLDVKPTGFNANVRIAKEKLAVGTHIMGVNHTLTADHYLAIDAAGVSNRFDFDDYYRERGFLEQFLPANFEYDQVSMKLTIEIIGNAATHNLYTNGTVNKLSAQKWEIQYPDFYNSSSIWYHLTPASKVAQEANFKFASVDGREIPAVVYSVTQGATAEELNAFVAETKRSIGLLEKRLGKFPHEQIILLMSDRGGGMEYAGATITDFGATYHEFAHSYFGRSVLSSSGRSAWIDEALASYVSANPPTGALPASSVNLASMSPYARKMLNQYPYSVGQAVVKNVKVTFEQKTHTSFDGCLAKIHDARKHTPNTTEFFKSDLETCLDGDLTALFDKYVYGKGMDVLSNKPLPNFFPVYNKRFTEY